MLQIFQSHGQAPAPIRVLIRGPGEIDLIPYAEHVLHGYDQEPRWCVREVARHRRKVGSLEAVLLQGVAQGIKGTVTLLARLAGVHAERLLDRQIMLVPPSREGCNIMGSERHQRVLAVVLRREKS